jgi:hypothetical protein
MQAPSKTLPGAAAAVQRRVPEAEALVLALAWEQRCLWSTRRLRCALTPVAKTPARTQP